MERLESNPETRVAEKLGEEEIILKRKTINTAKFFRGKKDRIRAEKRVLRCAP